MIYSIDGVMFRKMIFNAAAVVDNNKQKINELNVFPVPDGDTGTNMSMTLNNAVTELRKNNSQELTKVADTVASALLRGARGNSGVILSLIFRGFAKAWKDAAAADCSLLSEALSCGVDAAYHAIMKPTEGTILTVSRVSAECAGEIATSDCSMEDFFDAVLSAAKDALSHTVEQNPVLKKAGVVDAGGMGYVCILEGMAAALRNEEIKAASSDDTKEAADFSDFETEDIHFAYCTEFIVSRNNQNSPEELRSYLSSVGDSLVQVVDDDIIKVHVHTNEPGNVITRALTYGDLITVKIENMREQHTQKVLESSDEDLPVIAAPEKKYGIVAVCAGEGLVSAFKDLGADRIVEGGQTMNPSTQDILTAVNATPSEIVFVFPNNKNIILAAEQAIPLSEKKIVVIPTKTVPQGITALINFDASMDESELVSVMLSAIDTVSTMQITYAARDSEYDGQSIKAGEYLGLYNGSLFLNHTDINVILSAMASRVKDEDKEFISIFYGCDIEAGTAENAKQIFESTCTDADVTMIYGGQPVYYYLISAE